MARDFRRVDRDQQFLLPVGMREWLSDDHVVWVLLEVVEHLDVRELEARYARGGPGRRAYDPRMLLSLLIYAYSAGVRSSRQIERLCWTDVAMRVICGLQVPDHTDRPVPAAPSRFGTRSVYPGAADLRESRVGAIGRHRRGRHEDRCGRGEEGGADQVREEGAVSRRAAGQTA